MSYALLNKDGTVAKFPYSPEQLRADNPGTSFPAEIPDERLAEWGVYPVEIKAAPVVSEAETLVFADPVKVGDVWQQQWDVKAATAQERTERAADRNEGERARAEAALRASDYVELPSYAARIVNGAELAAYRAALLEIFLNPPAASWPDEPAVIWK